jgi:hypothetical protein
MRSITLAHVGYNYMNSRLIHDQTFTGCTDSLMGCTQSEQSKRGDKKIYGRGFLQKTKATKVERISREG